MLRTDSVIRRERSRRNYLIELRISAAGRLPR
jgi:hypothetical protein